MEHLDGTIAGVMPMRRNGRASVPIREAGQGGEVYPGKWEEAELMGHTCPQVSACGAWEHVKISQ